VYLHFQRNFPTIILVWKSPSNSRFIKATWRMLLRPVSLCITDTVSFWDCSFENLAFSSIRQNAYFELVVFMLNKKDLFYVEASLPVLNADKWGGREGDYHSTWCPSF